MKYHVYGTLNLNWDMVVEADSEEEAEQQACMWAEGGRGLGMPVDRPEVHTVEVED